MADLRDRQEALWAVLAHGSVKFEREHTEWYDNREWTWFEECTVYLPRELGALDVYSWFKENGDEFEAALRATAQKIGGGRDCGVTVRWRVPIPQELHDFVAKNTGRPMPRRYNSTAVPYTERDGIVWLTPIELPVYDALKAAREDWTFIPQPAFIFGSPRTISIPDFLIFWKGRPDFAVLVECDSQQFHGPEAAQRDQYRSRLFQQYHFAFISFTGKESKYSPGDVVRKVREFCVSKFGA